MKTLIASVLLAATGCAGVQVESPEEALLKATAAYTQVKAAAKVPCPEGSNTKPCLIVGSTIDAGDEAFDTLALIYQSGLSIWEQLREFWAKVDAIKATVRTVAPVPPTIIAPPETKTLEKPAPTQPLSLINKPAIYMDWEEMIADTRNPYAFVHDQEPD